MKITSKCDSCAKTLIKGSRPNKSGLCRYCSSKKWHSLNNEELKKACHYSNLQPLWAKDNWHKGNKNA